MEASVMRPSVLAFWVLLLPYAAAHVLQAPNVWQLPVPPASLYKAKCIFEEALIPRLVNGLIADLDTQPLPCAALDTRRGQFFVMRGGSSTNQDKRDSSDLAWISVNDEATFDAHAEIFAEIGVADLVAPMVDHDESIALYSCFYVVRSRCSSPNLHTDWPEAVGTNAFTLLTPLEDYGTADFQLLYKRADGKLVQYRYRTGEAIAFASRFVHSTEPGQSSPYAGNRPHVFLCFTFGSDKQQHWSTIAPTINGYQSRFLRRYDGQSELTELGRYLEAQPEQCQTLHESVLALR